MSSIFDRLVTRFADLPIGVDEATETTSVLLNAPVSEVQEDDQYWVLIAGEAHGPFTVGQLRVRVKRGLLSREDSVRSDEETEHRPMSEIPGFIPAVTDTTKAKQSFDVLESGTGIEKYDLDIFPRVAAGEDPFNIDAMLFSLWWFGYKNLWRECWRTVLKVYAFAIPVTTTVITIMRFHKISPLLVVSMQATGLLTSYLIGRKANRIYFDSRRAHPERQDSVEVAVFTVAAFWIVTFFYLCACLILSGLIYP